MTTAKKDMKNTKDALFALADTRIEVAGVMRCCLVTVAEEYEDQKVRIGMKSQCRHCKEQFTLTEAKPNPKWKPDWQLHRANKEIADA